MSPSSLTQIERPATMPSTTPVVVLFYDMALDTVIIVVTRDIVQCDVLSMCDGNIYASEHRIR